MEGKAKLLKFENERGDDYTLNQYSDAKDFLLLLILFVITTTFAYFLPRQTIQQVDYARLLVLLKKTKASDDNAQLSIEEVVELRSMVILIQ